MIKRIVESYLIAFALMNICGKETTDIFTVVFFAVAFGLLGKRAKAESGKDCIISGVTATLFTLFYMLGNWQALTGGLTNKLFLLFYFACTIAGMAALFYEVIIYVLLNSRKRCLFEEKRRFPIKGYWIGTAIIFLCMIPFLLINYPAVMTPDSLNQYSQAIGLKSYSDHHPWLHTMLISLFYHIGYAITQDVYSGIACYTVAQMLLVACSVAYVWAALYELGLKKCYCVAGMVLFVICPYNLVFSVTMWKDILFSAAVLVLTITLFRLNKAFEQNLSFVAAKRDWILYVISTFFMCMLRHNGFYAMIITAILLLGIFRKHLRLFASVTVGIFAVCLLIKGPVMSAAEVEQGKFVNNLCIPLQQIARVVAEGCDLTEEETQLLEKINDIEYIAQNYAEGGADPVKAWVEYGNEEYLTEHKAEYLKLWMDLGMRYPGIYVQAFIEQTKGYWYPMTPEQTVYWGITENEIGLVSQAILKGPMVLKLCEFMEKLYTIFPLYGMMYSMGAMFWFLLLVIAILIRNGRYGIVGCCLPVFWITITLLLATPLVADLRYNYPLMITMPCILFLTFYPNETKTGSLY